MYIDTHCHVISEYFSDIDNVLYLALKNGVSKIIVNGYDKKSNLEVIELVSKYDMVYGAIGFHPDSVDEYDEDFLLKYINHDKIVAVGEIGLDYYYDNSTEVKNKQKDCFKRQLDIALKYNKPVIIHCRDSIGDTYEILKNNRKLKGVLHCYSGSISMAKEFINLGFYLGVGGIITFKNAKNIIEVVNNIDLEHILLETDSPYLTPEPHRGKVNMPSYIHLISSKIALVKGISCEEVASVTTKNAISLFDF